MTRAPTNTKYVTIKIPRGLTLKIDEIVRQSDHDYTSRTDVIKDAVRHLYYGMQQKKK